MPRTTPTTKSRLARRLESLRRHPEPEAQRLAAKAAAFLELEANKDGRGTKQFVTREVHLALTHFGEALRAAQTHADSTIRQQAKKDVRAVRYEDCEAIFARLRKGHGRLSIAGRREAQRKKTSREAATRVQLTDEYDLVRVESYPTLQKIGRHLSNCLGVHIHTRRYLRDMKDGFVNIHVLRKAEEPVLVFTLDKQTFEMDECEGRGAEVPMIPREVAFRVLRTLGANGDDTRVFAHLGAFSIFLEKGESSPHRIELDGRKGALAVWNYGAELIIRCDEPDHPQSGWSRFSRVDVRPPSLRRPRPFLDSAFRAGRWNSISEEEMVGLFLDHPSLAEQIRAAAA